MSLKSDALRAVSYFSSTIFHKESIEEVLWEITKNVIHKLDYEDCVIYRFDKSTTLLNQVAAYGNKLGDFNSINNQIQLKLGEGIVGNSALKKEYILVNDTTIDNRYVVDDIPRKSELAVPILINDELFGVIDSENSELGFFGEDDIHLLIIISSICAQKISDLLSKKPIQVTQNNIYFQKFNEYMLIKKAFKNPELSLESTADTLGISAGYLSRLINDITGQSFAHFINSCRVNEVKESLQNKRFVHYSLLSIGLEAGFNSKASFQRNFKQLTGKTPSQYQQELS
jgi:AraC-like DNA-binding protein